jgi:hypothetical protein
MTDGYVWPFVSRQVRLEVTPPDGSTSQLDLRGRNLAYVFADQRGRTFSGTTLSTDATLAWMKGSGIASPHDDLRSEAMDLLEMARAAQRDEFRHRGTFYFTPTRYSGKGTGGHANNLAIFGFFLAAWCVGAWWVWRRGI